MIHKTNSTLLALLITISVILISNSASSAQEKKKKRPTTPSIQWISQPKPSQASLPPNTQHLHFQSKLVNQNIGYCIYLPPSYSTSQKRYPVIYTLHGNGGNEFTCLDSIALLHQGIESGKWPEMIMVLPNGGRSTFYKNSADGKFPIESIFMDELIPFIDSNYRTIASREGRCIEGFSMGGRGATRLAMKHPHLFCSLFCQAGNVPRLLDTFDAATQEERETMLLGDQRKTWEADDVYAVTQKNKDEIKKNVRIKIACGTADAGHLLTIRDFHQHLTQLGIDHTYLEIEQLGHNRTQMMSTFASSWFDYHVESLKLARPTRQR
ncbi:esterase family protein [Mariniblastus sp.]|nr:esterase family protein [Mariniblastus sp.]MDB4480890.1 esterase family protein [bacterium]